MGAVLAAAGGTTLPTVDWSTSIAGAATSGLEVLQDNVLYLFALPLAWVGFKVGKKIISKIS